MPKTRLDSLLKQVSKNSENIVGVREENPYFNNHHAEVQCAQAAQVSTHSANIVGVREKTPISITMRKFNVPKPR